MCTVQSHTWGQGRAALGFTTANVSNTLVLCCYLSWIWSRRQIYLGSGRSLLSAKRAAYGESLALERGLEWAEEERKGDLQVLEDGTFTTHATFVWDSSRSSRSPCICNICMLESPRTTNQSRSRIHQLRWPTTAVCSFIIIIISSNVEFICLFSTICQTCFITGEWSGTLGLPPTFSFSVCSWSSYRIKGPYFYVTTHQPSLSSSHSPSQHPSFERSCTSDLPGEGSTSAGHVVLSWYSTTPLFESFTDTLRRT